MEQQKSHRNASRHNWCARRNSRLNLDWDCCSSKLSHQPNTSRMVSHSKQHMARTAKQHLGRIYLDHHNSSYYWSCGDPPIRKTDRLSYCSSRLTFPFFYFYITLNMNVVHTFTKSLSMIGCGSSVGCRRKETKELVNE